MRSPTTLELQSTFIVNLQVEQQVGFTGRRESLLLITKLMSDGEVVGENEDYFPDDEVSHQKLQYRFAYLSRHLSDNLVDSMIRLYNLSGLATEIAKGSLRESAQVERILKNWRGLIPHDSRSRLVPKRKVGRTRKLTGSRRANFDKEYESTMRLFKDALARATLYKQHFPSRRRDEQWLSGWREIAETFIPHIPRKLVDKLVLEPSTASELAYEYLARMYKSGPSHLAKIVTEARSQRTHSTRRRKKSVNSRQN